MFILIGSVYLHHSRYLHSVDDVPCLRLQGVRVRVIVWPTTAKEVPPIFYQSVCIHILEIASIADGVAACLDSADCVYRNLWGSFPSLTAFSRICIHRKYAPASWE